MESSTETEELGTVTVPLTTAREEEEPTRNSQLQQVNNIQRVKTLL